ncbi:Endonuclease MutS2 [compost metagenome]
MLRGRHSAELEKLEQQRGRRLEKAEDEAAAIIAKARSEAEKIIEDLRRLAQEEGASVKEHKLIAARKQLDEAEPQRRTKGSVARKAAKPPKKMEPGDEVMVYSLNQKGHVVELAGKEATVQLGIMKMKVAVDDLELINAAPASKPQQRTVTNLKRTRDDNTRSELDLRGANLEEALIEVDRFIDEAYLGNLGQIYIIHGKGTGILRTGISDYLRKHKHIKGYRLGNYGEGGTGVTVAELK